MLKTALSIDTLETDGFVSVPLSMPLQAHIDALSWTWRDFLRLPEEVRRQFPYLPDTTNSGSGYEPPDASKFDFKHVFHAQLKHETWLRDQAFLVGDRSARELVEDTLKLLHMLQPVLAEFTDALQQKYPVGSLTNDLFAGYSECIIRLLHYPGGVHSVGEELAVQHVDKGAFTGHLYEDFPGVERLTRKLEWEPFPVHTGEALIFPAMRLQYRTKSQVKGLCHRVVAVEGAAEHGRNAMVLFGNFNGTPYYDKRRLGSMQGHGPGFNYEMPADEFEQLFTAPTP